MAPSILFTKLFIFQKGQTGNLERLVLQDVLHKAKQPVRKQMHMHVLRKQTELALSKPRVQAIYLGSTHVIVQGMSWVHRGNGHQQTESLRGEGEGGEGAPVGVPESLDGSLQPGD